MPHPPPPPAPPAPTSVKKGGIGSKKVLTPRTDLLPRRRDPDDNTLAPALMARLQRGPHHAHVPRAIKRIITPAIRHLHQRLLDTLPAQLGRIHKVRRPKLLAPGFLPIIHIHRDDLFRAILNRPLDHRQPHTPGAEDGDRGPPLHARRHDRGAVSRRDAAPEQAGPVHGRFVRDGHDRDVRDDGILAEGAGAHEMQEVFAPGAEARGAVGHDAFALGGADLAAQVRLAGLAEFAVAAFGRAVEGKI